MSAEETPPPASEPPAAPEAAAAEAAAPAATTTLTPPSPVPRQDGPDEVEEPFRERWFFDNPSLGRAIRYTFGEKRLARAVFVNALLLVVMLALIQELFGRVQLGLFSESISYGRVAFLGLVTVEAVFVSLLAPLGFVNLFEAERREECFDQVVTSGASPHRVVFGRYLATLAFLAVVLLSSLPFFATVVVLDGASAGQVVHAYAVLAGYGVCMASLAAACAVGFDDTALPALIAVMAVIVVLFAGFTRRGLPVFAAWSPIRHVVIDLNDIARGLRLANFKPPAPYGVEMAASLVSLAYYAVFSFIGLAYAYVGPDLELSRGLDSFDSVATSRQGEATRARRGVARTLLRTVQIRFFYENLSDRAQALSPLMRALVMVTIFTGAHVVFLGAVWPPEPPGQFELIARKTAYPYLLFSAGTLSLLALAGAGSRAALLARRPVALGPLRLGRFATLFGIMLFALAVPACLWLGAAELTGAGEAMTPTSMRSLYALVAGYAAFVFSVSLLLAMVTTNPYTATGWSLILLMATNLTPAIWIPLYTGNVAGEESAFLLDMSPAVAAYSLARPGDPFPFTRFEGDELKSYDHQPRWQPFAWFHLVIGLSALVAGLVLSRRELQARLLTAREALDDGG